MQKLNKLVYYHYNMKLRNRTSEKRVRDDPCYCPITLNHVFRKGNPLLPWIAEIKDLWLNSDPGFQQHIQVLIDEDMAKAKGQPPQKEGTSARSKEKAPKVRNQSRWLPLGSHDLLKNGDPF